LPNSGASGVKRLEVAAAYRQRPAQAADLRARCPGLVEDPAHRLDVQHW
jgi:hypothetical protein